MRPMNIIAGSVILHERLVERGAYAEGTLAGVAAPVPADAPPIFHWIGAQPTAGWSAGTTTTAADDAEPEPVVGRGWRRRLSFLAAG